MPIPTPVIKHKQLFINGAFVNAISGKTFATINPSTGEKLCDVSEAVKEDVDAAVAAAKAAFAPGSAWRTMDASKRGVLLNKLAAEIEADAELFAALDSLDNGKPYRDALNIDVALAVKCFRYYAGWADKIQGKTVPIDGNFFSMTRHEPIGVVAQIIPWNFPLLMAAWKLGPALAAGCTVVLKSAEQTPLSALLLASKIADVGFPPGVVNVLCGFGPSCGAHMVVHPDVDKVAFTGSTEVGRIIQKEAAGMIKNVTLELGGKSPAIVFPDADIDAAVEATHFALFFNAGQCCCAGSRLFVHESVYDEFVAKAAARAARRVVGAGLEDVDPATGKPVEQGPQVDAEQQEKILRLIESGKREGARLVCGGAKIDKPGFYVQPTVFADVTDGMEIAREEIFGPVMSILKFKTTEEVLARANSSYYGLAGAVYTKSLDTAMTVSMGLRAGTVWVNCYDVLEASVPFGGYKQSGIGRELGEYGLSQYCEIKTITIALEGVKNS